MHWSGENTGTRGTSEWRSYLYKTGDRPRCFLTRLFRTSLWRRPSCRHVLPGAGRDQLEQLQDICVVYKKRPSEQTFVGGRYELDPKGAAGSSGSVDETCCEIWRSRSHFPHCRWFLKGSKRLGPATLDVESVPNRRPAALWGYPDACAHCFPTRLLDHRL